MEQHYLTKDLEHHESELFWRIYNIFENFKIMDIQLQINNKSIMWGLHTQ
jgi:hypothetical protein